MFLQNFNVNQMKKTYASEVTPVHALSSNEIETQIEIMKNICPLISMCVYEKFTEKEKVVCASEYNLH